MQIGNILRYSRQFDPEKETIVFYRLEQGRFVTVHPEGDAFASVAVPGLVLDLARVRATFKPW